MAVTVAIGRLTNSLARFTLQNIHKMPLNRRFSDAELVQIVSGATNLADRLNDKLIPTAGGRSAAVKRLDRWKHLAANGDDPVFRRILASYGLADISETRLLGLLGHVRYPAKSPPPPWAMMLQEITEAVSASFLTGTGSRPFQPPLATRAIPFANLYSPIAVLARTKVAAMIPPETAWMLAQAWQDLQCHLLRRLSAICSPAMQPKFLAFKAVRQPGPASAFFAKELATGLANPTLSPYQAFIREQGTEGLRSFFLEYPVAARLAAQVTLSWIDFVAEFLRRLAADAGAISTRFHAGEPLGKIVAIKADLSDPHRAGRSVLLLDFESGCRLLYKPRPLQIDAAFFDLLALFNARCRLGPPPVPVTLVREDYGWQSYVAHSSCPNRREARRFYRRAGALLGLIHALRGIDFHCENLIAAGGHPIPVDLEALFHPALLEPVFSKDADGGRPLLDGSILRTGMLPVREYVPQTDHFPDYSALGAPVRQRSATAGVRWRYVNSVRMEAFWGRSRYACVTHRPRLHGRTLSARQHLTELVDGYLKATRLLRSTGGSAKAWRARIADLQQMTTRRIHRPTWLYVALIRSSLQPHLLMAGVDRSIALEALPAAPVESAVRRAEITALEMLDIPYFNRELTAVDAAPVRSSADDTDRASAVAAIRGSLRGNSPRRPDSVPA